MAEDAKPADEQVLTWLRELKPLPKIHYSWPVPVDKLSSELLYEYVRLTHAISLSGEWDKSKQITQAVSICKRVNADKPKIPASIGINFSIWHRRFGKGLPPTDIGPTHQAELDYLKTRMEAMKNGLAEANRKHDAKVAITAILFDSERFRVQTDNEKWNQAITAKYNAAYETVRAVFPKARIEWYGRGAVQPSADATGWAPTRWFTLEEKGESFNCSLYQVPEILYTREIFRRTARYAKEHGCAEVTPWVALASGYRRTPNSNIHKWSYDWNYDVIYSWLLGKEINVSWFGTPERSPRYAPWNKAKVVIFYPEPFARTPHWGKHFVAYVRGAHMMKSLPGE